LSTLNRLFKHTFVYGLATVLPRVLTVLLTSLLTAYLPDEDAFGKVSLVFSYIIFLNVLLTYGMETAFFRFFNEKENESKTLSTGLISILMSTLVFAGIAFLSIDFLAETTKIGTQYWPWIIGLVVFDTLMVIPFAYMRAQEKSTKYAVIKMVQVIISTAMATVFLIWLPQMDAVNGFLPTDKVELYIIAFFAASLITLILVARPYFLKWSFDKSLWKRMLSYGYPILIAGIAFAINETSDKVFLRFLLPENIAEAQVGIYTGCYRLAIGMTLFATAFKLGIEPFFFSEAKSKNAHQMYAQITKVYVILGSVALLVYLLVMDDVIKPLLLRKEIYWEAIDVVPIVCVAFLFFGIYQTLSVWYKVTDQTKYGAYISIAGAVLTILINVLFITKIGYMASAIATCVAYGFMMVVSYFLGRKHYAIPYDIKNLLLYLSISILFSCVFFYFFRDYFGVGSWQLYLVGVAMTAVLTGIILKRERTFLLEQVRGK